MVGRGMRIRWLLFNKSLLSAGTTRLVGSCVVGSFECVGLWSSVPAWTGKRLARGDATTQTGSKNWSTVCLDGRAENVEPSRLEKS